ncbi:MAG: electron transfer flavoprotein subunit alpha/FixB family protein, partial [Gammaproteobacteria bacterium]|nr:electron transfer flavoprotein subunit alpha/FixB family protein [Gammaproteobacteria bacterium]
MNKGVLVFVEQTNGKIAEVSLELISKAGELAAKLNAPVEAVVLGHEMQAELATLGYYGCETIYYIDDKRLAHFTSVPYAKTVVNMIKKHEPQIVLFGATTNGRDIAPRVASELRCGLTADCTELQIGDYESKGKTWENTLMQIRPAFGGNIVATIVSPESIPSMATVREGVMKLVEPDSSKQANIVAEPCELADTDFLTEVLEVVREAKQVNLKAANIIVAAGMGVSDQSALALVKELAKVLGAEVGCSRPVCDAGLLEIDRQIGQTVTTVRPPLYIACGI